VNAPYGSSHTEISPLLAQDSRFLKLLASKTKIKGIQLVDMTQQVLKMDKTLPKPLDGSDHCGYTDTMLISNKFEPATKVALDSIIQISKN
jgi:hypothetical protein